MSLHSPQKACNDNSIWRERYRETDTHGRLRARLLAHIPTARKLIDRYCAAPFKHDPEDRDYCFMEYQLCTLLEPQDENTGQRNLKIDAIAWVLERNPLILHNDPNLPF
jgi:hypothetical protein